MSKFTLTIVLDTLDDLSAFVAGIRHSVGAEVLDQVLEQAEPPTSAAIVTNGNLDQFTPGTAVTPAPITRRRKVAKDKPAAEAPLSSAPTSGAGPGDSPVVPQQAPSNLTYQLTDVREALQHVASVKGMDAAMALLTGYAAQRISDLPVEKYGAFINDCIVAEKVAA